jgi:hypothetical protein
MGGLRRSTTGRGRSARVAAPAAPSDPYNTAIPAAEDTR